MKQGSIIMIQRPNNSPCNGNTWGSLLPRNFVCNSQPEIPWQHIFGTQKVLFFYNSRHRRQPLLETLMRPQWCLYARISNRNAAESCQLVSCCFNDNAPAHKSRTSRVAVRKYGFVELNHPPYCPDLAPSDNVRFRNLKKFLRGPRFRNDNAVKETITRYFDTQDVSLFSAITEVEVD